MYSLHDRIKGALYGVAIGDALGAPLEFMDANTINAKYRVVTEMIGGGWLNVKPGEITDDTQMTIAVAKGIAENPDDPVAAVGKYFIEWYNSGPKDIGCTCANAIRRAINFGREEDLISKETWMLASCVVDLDMGGKTAGNGALMRTIYPALFYKPGNKMTQVTSDIAKMTHWSPESTEACMQYVKDICKLINGYNGLVGIETIKYPKPTGYVKDSYAVASIAINHAETFESVLIHAVNQGGDADTIGAIAGGMAGAKYGYASIPQRWIDALDPEVRKQLDELAEIATKRQEG